MTDDPTSRDRDGTEALLDALGKTARKERDETNWDAIESWTNGDIDGAEAKKASPLAQLQGAEEVLRSWDAPARTALADKMAALVAPPAPGKKKAAIPRRTAFAVGALLAAAAALTLVLPRRDLLPEYALSVDAGDKSLRSGEPSGTDPVPVVRDGSLLELRMRPTANVDRPVAALLFVRGSGDRELVVVDRPAEIAPSGAARWRGTARDLLAGRKGAVDVMAVVGVDGELPNAAEVSRLGPGHRGRWSAGAFRVTVAVE